MIDITAMFPVYVTEDLDSLKDFYHRAFGFQAVFYDKDFYLHLLHPQSGVQLGFLVPDHPTQPFFLHQQANKDGQVITFEVSNAAQAFEEAKSSQLPLAMDYKEESWGQKHFMVYDPQGFVIDIVEHMDTSDDQ